MPKYKGTCGCYNRDDARQFGLVPAIVWNDILDRSEHFDANPMWYDQKDASERLGIEYHRVNRAVKTLEDLGRITTKGGYRPKSSIKTTWVTINDVEISNSNFRNEQNEISSNEQNENPILKETKYDTDNTLSVRMKPSALRQEIARIFKANDPSKTQSNQAVAKLQSRIDDDSLIIKAARKMKDQEPIEIKGKTWKPDYFWFVNPEKTDIVSKRIIETVKSELTEEELSPWDQKRYDLAIKLGAAKDYEDCRDNWGMILPNIISTPEYRELENDR